MALNTIQFHIQIDSLIQLATEHHTAEVEEFETELLNLLSDFHKVHFLGFAWS